MPQIVSKFLTNLAGDSIQFCVSYLDTMVDGRKFRNLFPLSFPQCRVGGKEGRSFSLLSHTTLFPSSLFFPTYFHILMTYFKGLCEIFVKKYPLSLSIFWDFRLFRVPCGYSRWLPFWLFFSRNSHCYPAFPKAQASFFLLLYKYWV